MIPIADISQRLTLGDFKPLSLEKLRLRVLWIYRRKVPQLQLRRPTSVSLAGCARVARYVKLPNVLPPASS